MRRVVRAAVVMTAWMACISAGASARAADDEEEASSAVVSELVDPTTLTDKEKSAVMTKMLREQREAFRKASLMVVDARQSKDMAQLNCARKLSRDVKRLLDTASAAAAEMFQAIEDGQGATVNHEFSKALLAHQATKRLSERGQACVGEKNVYSGVTEVTVDVARNIAASVTKPTAPPIGPASTPPAATVF
jgi:hypothetical protein